MEGNPLAALMNQAVVLDTGSTLIYVGTLVDASDQWFALADADVHDIREGHATKEVYVLEAARDGVAINRRRVLVSRSAVMSVSRLDDVVTG